MGQKHWYWAMYTWMDLEGTALSDMSQTEKPYNVTSMGDLKRLNSRKETTDWWSAGGRGTGNRVMLIKGYKLQSEDEHILGI